MILKLEAVLNPAFQDAFVALTNQPLPALSAFRLAKILKQFRGEAAEFDTVRQASIKAHCSIPGDLASLDTAAFTKDVMAVYAEEIEVELVGLVELTDKITLTAQQVLQLEGFVYAPRAENPVSEESDSKIVPMPPA